MIEFPATPDEMNERHLIDRVFSVCYADDLDPENRKSANWSVGIALLGGVLLRSDELTRARLIKGLPIELQRAFEGIGEIMRSGPPR